jgi:hypothetical protein
MKKELLQDKKFAEAQKQFMRLCEWSYVPQTLEEEGDDENMEDMPQDDGQQDMPQMDDSMASEMPMGGDDMNNGDMQGNVGENPNQMPQQNQDMGDEMSQIGSGVDDMGTDISPFEDEMGGEDEEVIDVEELTSAQEKMNDKVNVVGQDLGDMSSKIESLIGMLGNMEKMITNNNQEIEKFKAEFEKRNPTQTEKLNLRSLDSYPFNVNPKDYWAEKGGDPNSNYSGFSNNEEPTTQEYQITNNDVDDFDEREIADSFFVDDNMRQDLKKIFGY